MVNEMSGESQAPDTDAIEKQLEAALSGALPPAEVTENSEATSEINEIVADPIPVTVPDNANVKLLPSKKDFALPEGITNAGMKTFMIPSKEQQIAGFYVDEPGLFVGQFRQFGFKHEKGTPKTQTVRL